jgi:hypothetical protein
MSSSRDDPTALFLMEINGVSRHLFSIELDKRETANE